MSEGEKITYFGETDFRNKKTKFGIKNKDRSRHVYIIGKTGMGKSTVLENMAAQDILNGEGVCFMDPHGSAIDVLIDYIPPERVKDVVYFAPFDTSFPMSFNVLEAVEPDKRHMVVAGLMASFKKIWLDAWSARMEYILSNTLLALLEYPGATLLGVNRMLAEKDYRNDVIKHITDASVKAFWIDEYNKWDPRYAREAGSSIQNKIGQFVSNPLIRNIIGQQKSSIDFRNIMDSQKIILINLSKGLIGETNGNLLGGMLITKLYIAAMSRADVGAGNLEKLPNFFFFVDEFQNFANESFADILSEARKYKLCLTVAHQYVDQLEEEVASAIFGNVGTMITFRIGATDAEMFEKQFAPTFTAEDIVNLGKFQIYLSLMIDGIGSRPFSGRNLPPIAAPAVSMREEIITHSRNHYAQPRAIVEANINKWYEPINQLEKRSITPHPDSKKVTQERPTSEKIEKRSFKIDEKIRNSADNPLKKSIKERDEKEAEVEMKKIVSPRLNELLEKMGTDSPSKGSTQKIIPKVLNNIKRYDASSDPLKKTGTVKHEAVRIPKELKKQAHIIVEKSEKKDSERGAGKQTMTSLQEALAKAMKGSSKHKNEDESQPTQKIPHAKQPVAQAVQQQEIKQEEIKNKTSAAQPQTQNSTPLNSPNKINVPISASSKKEVPEDILRGIFH